MKAEGPNSDAGDRVRPGQPDRLWVFLTVTLGAVALDQATKLWARIALAEGEALAVPWPGVLEIKLTYNTGIAFGLLQNAGVFLTPIAILIAMASTLYAFRHRSETAWSHIAMGLLASGAVGNLIDRIALGKVTDMIWIRAINFPVFNVADACITLAAAILLVHWARDAMGHHVTPPAHDSPANGDTATPPVGPKYSEDKVQT
jgi:signal peptidase II